MRRDETDHDDERWRAVLDRDETADGRFLYAVRGTGVYCRPNCPARRPRRENVLFYESPEAAERAGFRPCLRCRPDAATSPRDDRVAAVRDACRLLEESAEPPSLAELAETAGMSASHFQKTFKKAVGVTPKAYAGACRSNRFREALAAGRAVSDAVYAAGYGSGSRAYEGSGERLGMSPAVFRRGAPGLRIRYGLAETRLGWLLAAATDKGVCAIEFGDDPEALVAGLRKRFHQADLEVADETMLDWLKRAVLSVENGAPLSDLPLDIRGTAFQLKVWQALRDVPPGRTVSYSGLAERIGSPGAARAVGRACAENLVALAVPCHRAVGKDGSPTGYRWGVGRKKELLARERLAAASSRESGAGTGSEAAEMAGEETGAYVPDWQI